MDIALLQYILAQKKQGIPDEEITQMLMSRGWPLEAIDEGFKYISAHPEQVEFHNKTFSQTLREPMDLFNEAYNLIKSRLWMIILLSVISLFVTIIVAVIGIIFFFVGIKFTKNSYTSFPLPIEIIWMGIVALIIGFIQGWNQVAIYEVITFKDRKLSVLEALKKSFRKVIPYIWIVILSANCTLIGYLFFIVPGVFLSIWFNFAVLVFIIENEKGMRALIKSREYVRGLFKPVFIRLFTISFFSFLISSALSARTLLPDKNGLLNIVLYGLSVGVNILMTPLIMAYQYVLFENIRKVKGVLSPPTESTRLKYLLLQITAIIFAVLLVIALIGIPFLLWNAKPNKQFAKLNDTKRISDVNAILNAVSLYQAENKGALPAAIPVGTPAFISSTSVNICAALIPRYMAALPVDPLTNNGTAVTDCSAAYNTNYQIVRSARDNKITVSAPAAEVQATISAIR